MTLNKELVDFFREGIGKLDDYEIYPVFERFSTENIFDCLFNELQALSNRDYGGIESAWYLGRNFGDMSEKYPAEAKAYSWLINHSLDKKILFTFLLGYWEMSRADTNMLINFSNITKKAILGNTQWTENQIKAAIEAIATGYVDNQKEIESNEDNKNYFKLIFQVFQAYLLKIDPNSSGDRLIINHIL